jgi:hypothetical protein
LRKRLDARSGSEDKSKVAARVLVGNEFNVVKVGQFVVG